jgi:hypothetical protein
VSDVPANSSTCPLSATRSNRRVMGEHPRASTAHRHRTPPALQAWPGTARSAAWPGTARSAAWSGGADSGVVPWIAGVVYVVSTQALQQRG